MENSMGFLKKLKIELLEDPALHVYCSIIHKSQDIENNLNIHQQMNG